MKNLTALLSGFVFSIGLGVSGMMNPYKVMNFLDVSGQWDPSLLFVMGGALLVSFMGLKLAQKRETPYFSSSFDRPSLIVIDFKLVLGSTLFGVGWALAGICPGPAIANLFSGSQSLYWFVISLVMGLWLSQYFSNIKSKS